MGKLKNTFISILMGLSVIGAVRNSWGAPPVIPPTPTPGVTASDVVCTECVNDTDIAAGAVTEPKLAPGAVTNGKIADGAVTDAKITGPISAAKIEQGTGSGLNADLLDGLDSREFSKKPANIVVVAKSGGDFTSIQSAIDSINPTADNPYLIKVMPGVYPEFLILKSNIYLDGTAPSLTTISVSGLNVGYVISANGVSNTVVANFTIKCDRSYGIYPFYSSLSLIGNIITGCGVGIISDHSDTTVIENTIIGGNIGIEH